LFLGTEFDKDSFKEKNLTKIGKPFWKSYPVDPEGDPAEIAQELRQKYRPRPNPYFIGFVYQMLEEDENV
jgi:hypothetical protein